MKLHSSCWPKDLKREKQKQKINDHLIGFDSDIPFCPFRLFLQTLAGIALQLYLLLRLMKILNIE